MNKKIFGYLCILQTFILLVIITAFLISSFSISKVSETNLSIYMSSEYQGYIPDTGFVPDAKTAEIIGSRIIKNLKGDTNYFSVCYETIIEYDKEHRLWKVEKNYLFSGGGIVIIEQDSGEIINAHLTK